MKLSVLDLVPLIGEVSAQFALQQALLLAQTAERLGYHRYWVAEHHDMPGLACTAPEVLLAHIGALTKRIRIGSGALLLPHYKPIKVAESFHLLAALYPDRIDLGIGRAPGGSAHVSMALSSNFLENLRLMPDSLKALMELLTHTYRIEGEPVLARPIPVQAPEVWMLGTNHKSASYAAQYGTGYVFGQFMSDNDASEMLSAYRQQYVPSALSNGSRTLVAVGVICAETEETARQLALQAAKSFKLADHQEEERAVSKRKLLMGTPQHIKSELDQLGQFYGVDEFIIVTPILDYEQRLRSFELLAEAML
ncbi:MsnO8 family LLM class oxidoreductase [Paenibacillus sp. 1_12]|uniref:MsnO8 family LLM class oxidoreductase n=1 Tax=Paenibacillus sp. 1_12 TaxID=1566278 RepID=UPI00210A7F59|nr:MsnO8 family LLM class oxidoreductase [Paenibacillus sp. 1_12]